MQIRQAHLRDRNRVRRLYLSAFSEAEREAVADLAANLLAETTTPETLALVAEMDDNLIGHIAFSPVARRDTDHFLAYILAPLAVHPEFHKQGIGTELIVSGMEYLSCRGVDIVFVYGDPQYYGRFGFDAGLAAEYVPPYQLQYEFGWQSKPLADINRFPSSARLTCVESLKNPQLW